MLEIIKEIIYRLKNKKGSNLGLSVVESDCEFDDKDEDFILHKNAFMNTFISKVNFEYKIIAEEFMNELYFTDFEYDFYRDVFKIFSEKNAIFYYEFNSTSEVEEFFINQNPILEFVFCINTDIKMHEVGEIVKKILVNTPKDSDYNLHYAVKENITKPFLRVLVQFIN